MTEPKPTRYARLSTTTGEVLFRKDRIVLIQLMRMDRPDKYNREEIKVFVVMQTDGANSRQEAYYVPSMKAYDDFLKEVYDD